MRTMRIALMCAAIVCGSTPARAQTEVRLEPGYIAKGDAGTDLRCGAGRFIVGFDGASGTNLDRIRLLCATVAPDTSVGPIDHTSAVIGGPGGGFTKATCPDGMYVYRIEVKPAAGLKQVERIFARCTSHGKTGGFDFGPTGPGAARANFLPYIFDCPPNAAATGLILRYGKHINDVGLICSPFYVPPPPAPPAPPAPPPTPKPPPRVVGTGINPQMPSFVGRWKMTSRSGNSATFVINEADGNDIFGTLSSSDPKYNGAFTGVVGNRGRNFTFTYRDAATGKSGSGKMLYRGFDPNGIIGGVKSDGPPPFEEVWGGARQK